VTDPIRIGVDVGGTFTKAVAVSSSPLRIHAHASVPTTHTGASGVAEGVASALRELTGQLDGHRDRVELVAFSTTQAMNALLEGDVQTVGVVGIGYHPELRVARKRTRPGEIALAPGRKLATEHEFVDATAGLTQATVEEILARLELRGATAIAVSGAFAVDTPADENAFCERARCRGLAACAGNELTGAYGLETRTLTAAVNASILPIVERTATLVEEALVNASLDVPLLVLRGDGGSMSAGQFRRQPSLTIGSAPAAGVAAVLHELRLADAIVVECGGTSTNVSVIRGGRPQLRTLRVMNQPTFIRAVDSWVVGAAGGSMALVGRRGISEVGPRSAHIAGLQYACFAPVEEVVGARLALLAPRDGDPEAYACVETAAGRYALTATCAANALGLVPDEAYPYGSQAAALAAFVPLGERLGTTAEGAARKLLDGAVRKIAAAVAEAAKHYRLDRDVPLVALGGAGAALVPEVARALGRRAELPVHAEVLSAVGAAVSLVRAEAVRSIGGELCAVELARSAERSCIDGGAAPSTVTVETIVDNTANVIRAVATGSVALQAGAADHREASDEERIAAAAAALELERDQLEIVAGNEFYCVYSGNGAGGVAVVDRYGAVALADQAEQIVVGERQTFMPDLERAVASASRQLGVATMLPRVSILAGSRMIDLSSAHSLADISKAAGKMLEDHPELAVAVIAR
jgi:N-methylhydantoinase A/oxoprolinase/acetone carboxylase beta subunit